MSTRLRKVVFLWENFGPMHIDRCGALARALEGQWQVVGVQWTGKSTTYDWVSPDAKNFSLVTLFPDARPELDRLCAKVVANLVVLPALAGRCVFLQPLQ